MKPETEHLSADVSKETMKLLRERADKYGSLGKAIDASVCPNNALEPSVESSDEPTDFDSFACIGRRPYNATDFQCWGKKPMMKIRSNLTVPKDICRTCQRLQLEEHFLNDVTLTKSGELYRRFLKNKERERHAKEMENLKTQGVKERKQLKQGTQQFKVDYGESVGIEADYSYR